ncbi:GNAT family N-acetyltransferase [Microbacterium sp. NPDC058345]|uniref:GNAT family N-acetyltransferase n=1 Tax=Microbacterium sp. NPDC058345 TaxID=3346455 RepID=UPI00364FD17C
MHEIDCEVTHVGSAEDADLLLRDTDPLHAKIKHDLGDEYVLEMVGKGDSSHGPDATLRTGAQFTAGPWRLVYARDEFADHGRPYGGRNGGEGAHQKRQKERPDYAQAHPVTSLARCELKNPDNTSSPKQVRAIQQAVLADANADAAGERAVDLRVVNDERAGIYEALVGDREVGGVTYNLVGDDRIALLAVSVFPEFRGQGIATDLIRAALDDVRANRKTITNYCPVVATFIESHADYADVIDRDHPGIYRRVQAATDPESPEQRAHS